MATQWIVLGNIQHFSLFLVYKIWNQRFWANPSKRSLCYKLASNLHYISICPVYNNTQPVISLQSYGGTILAHNPLCFWSYLPALKSVFDDLVLVGKLEMSSTRLLKKISQNTMLDNHKMHQSIHRIILLSMRTSRYFGHIFQLWSPFLMILYLLGT